MKIVIHNYLAGSFLLEKEPCIWDAIVILDSGLSHTSFVADHARSYIYLRFDDVIADTRGKRLATVDDIRSAIEFASHSENLMVCCRAGQSRSAALAFVIGCHRLGPKRACDLLNPKRHVPNSVIVDLGAKLLDDLCVREAFVNWKMTNQDGKLPSSCYDEMEQEFDELERKGARNRIIAS